ncbi:MAG: cytochrome P450, partial [Paracoccaceae bacterium]
MVAAGEAAIGRLGQGGGALEMEAQTAHLAADVIFRTLFSLPITDTAAADVHRAFRRYQRAQPLLSLADLLRLPRWVPRLRPREARRAAAEIRTLLAALVARRQAEIAAGTAPDDLATKIMTMRDPQTGSGFSEAEMADQVAIFFLAGHETSASALAWALYLLALDPPVQERLAREACEVLGDASPSWDSIGKLAYCRDVFRETLRLYPPVPMLVREAAQAERFRDRDIAAGSVIVLSPWHLQRHERLWSDPDVFDPGRWRRPCPKDAYMPFSQGPRICTGAGFAMVEGVLFLAMLARAFRFERVPARDPVPVAHLTVRAKDGIWLRVEPRGELAAG